MSECHIFNISLLGESEVGKTSILKYYEDKIFENVISTIGIDISMKKVKFPDDEKEYKFKIFDTAGQERFKSISYSTIQLADGFLMVFAVNNRKSFQKINEWFTNISEHVDLKEKVIFIVGNKIDLVRQVQKEEGEEFANKMGIKYKETSAKTGEGTEEVFQDIYNDIYERYKKQKHNNNDKRIKLDSKNHKKNNFFRYFKKVC
jgi:small GTP-binding protein